MVSQPEPMGDKWSAMIPDPHPMANCGPLLLPLPAGATCPTCGTTIVDAQSNTAEFERTVLELRARYRSRLERMATELRKEGYHVDPPRAVCPHCVAKDEPHPSRDAGVRCSWCGRPAGDPVHDPRRAWSGGR